jgi:teichuronic acid biosynthesis glycosyltransferase TuaC
MRVLFITSSYPAHQDDPRGIFVHRLARGLYREGVQVSVLTPGMPFTPFHMKLDGVDVLRTPYWIPKWQYLATGLEGMMPNLRQQPWLWLQVPSLVLALTWRTLRLASSFDVIHAHWLYPAGVAGAVAARYSGIPLVVTSHGGDLNLARQSRFLQVLTSWVSRTAQMCVGVSTALCEQFLTLGSPSSKIAFISSAGIDRVEVVPPSEGEASSMYHTFKACPGFRLIYVGSLTPRKSVETLLEAHHELERRGYVVGCALVGPGPERERLQTFVQERFLRNVFFVGSQPPSVVPAWMLAAQAVILPSLSEGRPNVVLEAMGLGVPVVATDIPGTREMIRNRETGLLFAPRDVPALVDCIAQLIQQEALRVELGRQAQEYIRTEGLTTAHAVQRYMAVYRKVL